MALTEEKVYRYEANEFGDCCEIEVTKIMRDGVEISKSYHRKMMESGNDMSKESEKFQAFYNAAQINKMAKPQPE